MNSNCKPALMHWFQICVHQQKVFTPSKQRTHSMWSAAKKYITSGTMKWCLCMIQKREVEQIFTCFFPAPLSVPYHIQMITTISIDLMNFLKYFSLHFVFHSFDDSCGIFFICYMERSLSKDHEINTDAPTALMLTKCVNTLTGNLTDFH